MAWFGWWPGLCIKTSYTGAIMSDTYIIEVSSQAAGIVVRDPDGYRFFAASHRFNPMEGQLFRNAREAERAAFLFASQGFLTTPVVTAA